MKRYFVFYGYNYYPNPAMADFIGDFDNYDEAYKFLVDKAGVEISRGEKWGEVWDSNKRQSVYSF